MARTATKTSDTGCLPNGSGKNGQGWTNKFAFKNPANSVKTEREYLAQATEMRDGLKKRIPNYKSLFEPSR